MYLLLFKHPESDYVLQTALDGQVQAYEHFGDLIKCFDGFIKGWTSPSWGGATISMMNLQPKAVEFNSPAEDLAPFIISTQIIKLNQFGMIGDIQGCQIKESFMEGKKVVDIWKETMIRGGIKDPNESDLIGKQQELSL